MKMLKDQNFDEQILQDSLFNALKNSKLTNHLINLRAEQIVQNITKDHYVKQLMQNIKAKSSEVKDIQRKYDELSIELKKSKEKEEKRKKIMHQELNQKNQQILIKFNQELELRQEQNQALIQQINALNLDMASIKQENELIFLQKQQKEKEISMLKEQNSLLMSKLKEAEIKKAQCQGEFEKLLKNHQTQMQKNFTKNKGNLKQIELLKSQIEKLKKQIEEFETNDKETAQMHKLQQSISVNQHQRQKNKLQKEVKRSQAEKDKLKKELSQSEQNYQLIKKQIGKFKQKYKRFEEDFNDAKILHAQAQNYHNQKQKKYEEQINELKQSIKNYEKDIQILSQKKLSTEVKIKSFFKNNLFILNGLKFENQALKKFIAERVNLMKEYSESLVMKIINHISTELNEHFQECILEIRKARQEKYIAKQQLKLKNQIIEHLDKLLNNQAKSVYDLKSELRIKKKEQEKLRKKLKYHYQETDKKLEDFQKKYISILKDQY